MAETTKIEWTDHTASPWHGCTKVSPGCANCYAERQSVRNPLTLGVWGNDGTRVKSKSFIDKLRKWNSEGKAAGIVTLSPRLESVIGVGEKDAVLNELIAESALDHEPSPLEPDPPGQPMKVRLRNRA